VIVALHQVHKGGRSHVPYRNSLLTLFLKDSLGGNCKTVMVATLSMEQAQAPETISTCRFAQTVAMIPNSPSINEEFDPHAEIKRLKVTMIATQQPADSSRLRQEIIDTESSQHPAASIQQPAASSQQPAASSQQPAASSRPTADVYVCD
jgi:hypothetical protein